MVAVVGSILAELTLDRRGFDKNLVGASTSLRRFEQTSGSLLQRMDQRSNGIFSRIGAGGATAFGALAKSAALTLAPILGVAAALSTARAGLDDFDRIAKNAKAAGLDGQTFQEFSYAAELGGISTEEFSKALETFNKNAGLAAEGKGKMVTALKALNPELLRNILATKDQAERLKLAADAIDKAGSASEKAALATTLFGESGTRMVEVLKGGRAALAETAAAARNLGIVVDNELLARSEEMSDSLSTATKVLDVQFKTALVELAPILVSTAQLAGNLASAVNYLTQSVQSLENRSTARLEQDYQGLMATLDEANADRPGVVGNMGVSIDPEKQAEMQAQADAMRAELKRRAIAKLASDLNKPKMQDFSTPGAGRGNNAANAANKQAEAVKALIANLEHERLQLGRTNEEQELYGHLKGLGVERESTFGQAVEAALGPLQRQRAAIEDVAKAAETLGEISRDVLGGLAKDMFNGVSGADALNNAVGRLRDRMMDMGLDLLQNAGITLFKSLFGGMGGGFGTIGLSGVGIPSGGFTPGLTGPLLRAGGGAVFGPGSSKSDSIPVMLSNGEFVVNADSTRKNRSLLEMINSGADMFRGFASGGIASRSAAIDSAIPSVQSSGLGNVKIEMVNESGQPLKTTGSSVSRQGDVDIVKIVIGAFNQGAAQGLTDGAMSSIYGLKRRGA